MPSILWSELERQPEALRGLARFYLEEEGQSLLQSVPAAPYATFTGMGASYHAAWICALQLTGLGVPASQVEATDLLHYTSTSLAEEAPLVYFSQSGSSGEVEPVLQILAGRPLVAITNEQNSLLARQAAVTLPLLAGREQWIASKTYLNTLALGWLLAYRLAGRAAPQAAGQLEEAADRCQAILARADEIAGVLLDFYEKVRTLVFTGHGPHAATARQAAMLVSEWARRPALYASAGGFRHGFIEMVEAGTGVVLFAPPGRSQPSALALAREMDGYGLPVLVISNGETAGAREGVSADADIDEFLSPILDILPVQVFVDRLAGKLGITPGFRRIQKVVTRL